MIAACWILFFQGYWIKKNTYYLNLEYFKIFGALMGFGAPERHKHLAKDLQLRE